MSDVYFQHLYGELTNWRSNKINDRNHKYKVIGGYSVILGFVRRATKNK